MAFSGVEGPVGGDAGDLLIWRDLIQQIGQHGRIAHHCDIVETGNESWRFKNRA